MADPLWFAAAALLFGGYVLGLNTRALIAALRSPFDRACVQIAIGAVLLFLLVAGLVGLSYP